MPDWYSSDPPEQKLWVFTANSSWQTAREPATLITGCNSWLPSAGELLCVTIFYHQDLYPGKFHGIWFPALQSAVTELLVLVRFGGLMVTLVLQNNTVITKNSRANLRHKNLPSMLFGFTLKRTNPNHHPNSFQTNTACPNKNLIIFKLILKKNPTYPHIHLEVQDM